MLVDVNSFIETLMKLYWDVRFITVTSWKGL